MTTGGKTLLTVLNSMAGADIYQALDRHVEWGLRVVDLKDGILGKSVEALSVVDANTVAGALAERKLTTNTLSTCLFSGDIEEGETAFRARYAEALKNVVAVAPILKPKFVRLLAAGSSRRGDMGDSAAYIQQHHPWLLDVYREGIDRVRAAGFEAIIENEVGHCIFSNPREILDFFSHLDRAGKVGFTWDIQNLWQMGTLPGLDVYRRLKPLIRMIHLKGGRAETPGGPLKWKSHLEDASWPVLDICRAAIADGVSPVICLNPSHGADSPDYKYEYRKDIEFLRKNIKEIE
jgi:sugar phosphate isomerase/epimerase